MSVRAKMKCVSNTHAPGSESATVSLYPVTSGSKENDDFYKWTPSGNVLLSTINPAAAEQFVVGKEYYVDFTPAE